MISRAVCGGFRPFIRQQRALSTMEALREKVQSKLASLDHLDPKGKVPLTHQGFAGRKRFYKHVGVKKIAENKFGIELDGRTLRTPARNNLHLPTFSLALAIAAEWDAQTDQRKGIEPVTMPLMTLASTAIDQIAPHPEGTIETVLSYMPTDSALYFTTEQDRYLYNKQQTHLLPILSKFNDALQIRVATTQDMSQKISHPVGVQEKIAFFLSKLDCFTLAAVQSAVKESKSLVLSLSLVGKLASLQEVVLASRLEEEVQCEIWGVVEGGHDMDRLNNSVGLSAAHTFTELLGRTGTIFDGAK
ncbi:hypothetical protein EON64_06445 [archaeon]|nr:MAG: hypothetical protein EON64_06445 [archaeon]